MLKRYLKHLKNSFHIKINDFLNERKKAMVISELITFAKKEGYDIRREGDFFISNALPDHIQNKVKFKFINNNLVFSSFDQDREIKTYDLSYFLFFLRDEKYSEKANESIRIFDWDNIDHNYLLLKNFLTENELLINVHPAIKDKILYHSCIINNNKINVIENYLFLSIPSTSYFNKKFLKDDVAIKLSISDSKTVLEVIDQNLKNPIYQAIFKPYECDSSVIRNLIYGIYITEKGQEILQLENFYDFNDEHLKTLEMLNY